MSVEDMLMELGRKVTASAANLTEAIEMAAGGTFDCALLVEARHSVCLFQCLWCIATVGGVQHPTGRVQAL